MGRIGPLELGILVFLVLIIFGVGRLPQVGGAIGKGIREFRSNLSGRDVDVAEKESVEDSRPKS